MKFISKENEFTLLIGRGLSALGRIEMALAEVFAIAVQSADPNLAERVFWSVNSLDARTSMVRAALKCAYPRLGKESRIRGLWTEVALEIEAQAKKRAELAHGNYLGVFWLGKRGGKHRDQFFAPFYGKTTAECEDRTRKPKYDPRPPRRLYIPDLEARITDFMSLEGNIPHLIAHLAYELQQAGSPRGPAVRSLFRRGQASTSQTKKATPPSSGSSSQ
jgi:hypothetical protein